jgi:hypothetical protein
MIEQTKKMRLDELKVDSFVIDSTINNKTILGGTLAGGCRSVLPEECPTLLGELCTQTCFE